MSRGVIACSEAKGAFRGLGVSGLGGVFQSKDGDLGEISLEIWQIQGREH